MQGMRLCVYMYKIEKRCKDNRIEGYPSWFSALLSARGVKDLSSAERFLNPRFESLYDPFLLHDMDKAIDILRNVRENNKKVMIYGDYDVDGICACAILSETLDAYGIRNEIYIPDRYQEGYGINKEAVKDIAERADVLLSCDCGITALEEVEMAKLLGLNVIISDHHHVPSELPKADAIVVPSLGTYPFPFLCGAGVAWKMSCALMGFEFAKKQLDLAALATIADMVSLTDENRVIVYEGLKCLSESHRPGVVALKEISHLLDCKEITAEQVAFQLAPRLNAGGRFSCAYDAFRTLNAKDEATAKNFAKKIDDYNILRKLDEKSIVDYAFSEIAHMDLVHLRSIVVVGENFNSGVVGLAAGKIANAYAYPCVVLTKNGEMYVGSGRSGGGVDLYSALSECRHLFERFGGHTFAAGLSIKEENIAVFRCCFDEAVKRQLAGRDLLPTISYDTELNLEEVNIENYRLLSKLSPFGTDNPQPVFLTKNIVPLSLKTVGADNKHLKLTVQDNNEIRDVVGFGLGYLAKELPSRVDLFYSMQLNFFRGKTSCECLAHAILPGTDAIVPDDVVDTNCIALQMESALKHEGKNIMLPQVNEVKDIPNRGTLLVCYSSEMAKEMHQKFPHLKLQRGLPEDKRCFSTIVYQVKDIVLDLAYSNIIYCDGIISEKMLICSKGNEFSAISLPQSKALKNLLNRVGVTIESLRKTYLAIKDMSILRSYDEYRINALILQELGLIKKESKTNHYVVSKFRKCDPKESWIFRAIGNTEEV